MRFLLNGLNGITLKEGVEPKGLYTPSLGYGFVTQEIKNDYPFLQNPEAVTGFVGKLSKDAFHLRIDTKSIYRNYAIQITFIGEGVSLFTTRRRCIFKNLSSRGSEPITYRFTTHVGAIITESHQQEVEGSGIDLVFMGKQIQIKDVSVEVAPRCKTLFLAGDSTVTDQKADLPYDPYHSYCGWGQMLPIFMKEGLSLSNQAHSGLTTESFRAGGHFDIIKKEIQKGDFVAIQFGHNDQKLDHLDAKGGYKKNLEAYIDEIRALGALPLLVTSVSRNTWNGQNGAYNDMLEAYAKECIKIGKEKKVPVLDLHEKSKAFILAKGMEESTKYFHPGDWTHTNDYGGRQMALFVVEEIQRLTDAEELKDYKMFIDLFGVPWQDEEEQEIIQTLPKPEKELLQDKLKGWEKENEWLSK